MENRNKTKEKPGPSNKKTRGLRPLKQLVIVDDDDEDFENDLQNLVIDIGQRKRGMNGLS